MNLRISFFSAKGLTSNLGKFQHYIIPGVLLLYSVSITFTRWVPYYWQFLYFTNQVLCIHLLLHHLHNCPRYSFHQTGVGVTECERLASGQWCRILVATYESFHLKQGFTVSVRHQLQEQDTEMLVARKLSGRDTAVASYERLHWKLWEATSVLM